MARTAAAAVHTYTYIHATREYDLHVRILYAYYTATRLTIICTARIHAHYRRITDHSYMYACICILVVAIHLHDVLCTVRTLAHYVQSLRSALLGHATMNKHGLEDPRVQELRGARARRKEKKRRWGPARPKWEALA